MGEGSGIVGLKWKPPRVFYGWWIVGACFLIALYTGGAIFYGFTAYFEPIANEFGWSYAQVSFAASLRGLEVGLLSPFLGILADRWGPRRLIFAGVVIAGLGLLLFSRTTSLGMFYGSFALLTIGVSACTSAVLLTAVANWFRRRVSLATGIAVSGFGFGGFLIPVMVRLIDLYEWRMAMVILALGLLAMGLPLSLLVRHKPEQYGYLPDGEVSGTVIVGEASVPAETNEVEFSAKQALKSRTFWHITLALMPQFMALMALITHVMPYLSSVGIARSMSSLVATGIPLLSIGGRLSFGWLGDKFNKRWITVGALTVMSLGLLCFEYSSAKWTWPLVPFLIFFGIGYGGGVTMRASLLSEYFGRSSFGANFGFLLGIQYLAGMAGPPLAGWVFDHWGSYQGVWLAFAGLTIMGAIIMALTPTVSTKSE